MLVIANVNERGMLSEPAETGTSERSFVMRDMWPCCEDLETCGDLYGMVPFLIFKCVQSWARCNLITGACQANMNTNLKLFIRGNIENSKFDRNKYAKRNY